MNKIQKIFILIIALLVAGMARLCAYELTGNSPGYTASNIYMVATVLVHETGGLEDFQVQQVANVIINRFDQYQGKKSIGDILFGSKYTFSGSSSYFNKSWTDEQVKAKALADQRSSAVWNRAVEIATKALNRQLADLTHGANSYQRCKDASGNYWSKGSGRAGANNRVNDVWQKANRINLGQYQGDHCFYNVELGGGANIHITGQHGSEVLSGGRVGGGLSAADQGLAAEGAGLQGEPAYDNGKFKSLNADYEPYLQECKNATKDETLTLVGDTDRYIQTITKAVVNTLDKIYDNLTKVYIRGSSLMCYGMYVDYTRVEAPVVGIDLFDIPNFSYLLSGGTIYMVGFFMSMSVGLYFIDIALKLALAVLFLPISIALWPFPPTKDKLSENLSVVIRNSMLFTFVAIGVYFALALLGAAFDSGVSQEAYAEAVKTGRSQLMSDNYAFFTTNFLLIAFCLVYGFRMMGSAAKDYLDKIFADGIFGGSSPVHRASTGALDFAKRHTVDPMVGGAKRAAMRGAGGAMIGLGNIFQGNFEGVKNFGNNVKNKAIRFGNVVAHPWMNARHATAALASGVLQKYGNFRKDLHDYRMIFGSRHFYTEKYDTESANYAARRDAKTQSRIDAINQKLGVLQNRETYADGQIKSETYQDRDGNNVTNNYDRNGIMTSSVQSDAFGNVLVESNYDDQGHLSSQVTTGGDGSKTQTTFRPDGTKAQEDIVSADGKLSTIRYDKRGQQIGGSSSDVHAASAGAESSGAKDKSASTSAQPSASTLTLTPGNLLNAALRPMASTRETYQTLSRLASSMQQDWSQEGGKGKVMMKVADGVMKFALRSAAHTAGEASHAVGSIFKMFGETLVTEANKGKKSKPEAQSLSSAAKPAAAGQRSRPTSANQTIQTPPATEENTLADITRAALGDNNPENNGQTGELLDQIISDDAPVADPTDDMFNQLFPSAAPQGSGEDPADQTLKQILSEGETPEAEEDEDVAKLFDEPEEKEQPSRENKSNNDTDENDDPLAGIPSNISDGEITNVLQQLESLPNSPEVDELREKLRKRQEQLGNKDES